MMKLRMLAMEGAKPFPILLLYMNVIVLRLGHIDMKLSHVRSPQFIKTIFLGIIKSFCSILCVKGSYCFYLLECHYVTYSHKISPVIVRAFALTLNSIDTRFLNQTAILMNCMKILRLKPFY